MIPQSRESEKYQKEIAARLEKVKQSGIRPAGSIPKPDNIIRSIKATLTLYIRNLAGQVKEDYSLVAGGWHEKRKRQRQEKEKYAAFLELAGKMK
jgi:hypothetical protein